MTIHASRSLAVHVAAVETPTEKHALQHVFLRRFHMQMEDEASRAYAEHAWQVQTPITRQAAVIEAEIAYSNNDAVRILKAAAMHGTSLVLQITFPDGDSAEGSFNLTEYNIFAEAGDALRIGFIAHSRSALTLLAS